eukprot:Blabericola_migrator_1__7746@NODE_395_length_8977_cov_183_416835_g72_i1_p7_GENE_NODE_395_length_8977_cov_183_416835_g72_i1NODE_395_length_8977_cov_183_416835_g72_i1_p7_ORF_typecomplete_len159_score7_37C2/PF00168_30/1e11_NODE_395_length_8977_cov_183_416835_g72_i157936269
MWIKIGPAHNLSENHLSVIMMHINKLYVTVVSAYNMPYKSGIRDLTDPYVQLQVGGKCASTGTYRDTIFVAQKLKTTTKKDAGSEAQYDEVMTFVYHGEPYISVSLYDHNRRKDTLLGSGKLDLSTDILMHGFRGVIRMMDKKDKHHGDVLLNVHATS